MPPPAATTKHYQRLQRLKALVVGGTRRVWSQMDPAANWQEQYQEQVGPQTTALVVAGQMAAAQFADDYVPDVLAELDLGRGTRPGVVNPRSIAAVAGDGRPVDSLLARSVVKAGQAFTAYDAKQVALPGQLSPAEQALADAEAWIDMVAETILADAARAAEAVAFVDRDWVEGYVRMLQPPSCSRCVILAGRFYRWNDGFDRHPLCDCIHIPASEADSSDLRVNPGDYFDSLDPTAQDKAFSRSGAEAIRLGADMNQVVNARRGMAKAQLFSKRDLSVITSEGVTRRGAFWQQQKREGRNMRIRLMPETIFDLAEGDRAEAKRLLRIHGFILPA
jgi:hypothetical protein